MTPVLKNYLRRLTNLSSRNKSLLLTRLAAEQFADLHDADFLQSISSFEVLQQILQRRKKIVLCDLTDPRYEKVNNLSRRLKKIARTVDFIAEERGSRSLFIGYPFVRGKFLNGQVVHAPLLFFPVSLDIERNQWCLRCDSETGPHLNRSFALAYGQFTQIAIPDSILEMSFDEFPTNITFFRTELYKWLRESPFDVNFNQDLFEDRLSPFEALKAKDLESIEKNGELKLYPEAVLGIFPQTGSYLEEDYNFLLKNNEAFSIGNLAENQLAEDKFREEDLLAPFALDASQELALSRAKQGENLVIQGPPGSGKSQLICNLMADYAARGKRVLLVCQKKAALDVVYNRLQKAGIGNFTALIHDHLADRSALYKQMAGQISQIEKFQKDNYSIDSIFQEREFKHNCRLTDRLVSGLSEFKTALFDESVCGVSVKELYLTSDPAKPEVNLTNLLKAFPMDRASDSARLISQYFKYLLKLGESHSWIRRRDFSTFNLIDQKRIQSLLDSWPDNYSKLDSDFNQIFSLPLTRKHLIGAGQLKITLKEIQKKIDHVRTFRLFRKYLLAEDEKSYRLAAIDQLAVLLRDREGVEGFLDTSQVSTMCQKVNLAIDAKSKWMSGYWWEWFSADKKDVSGLTDKHSLTTSLQDLQILLERLKNRQEADLILAEERLGFNRLHYSDSKEPLLPGRLFLGDAKEASEMAGEISGSEWFELIISLIEKATDLHTFQKQLNLGINWISRWEQLTDEMDLWLVPEQFNQLLADPQKQPAVFKRDLQEDFDNLVEMDGMWQDFSQSEQVLAERLRERGAELNFTTADQYRELFDNSLRLAWIDQIEQRFPVLRAASSLKLSNWEHELQESVERKKQLSAEIVKIRLQNASTSGVAKNRLGNTVTYRELYHQLTKKRRIWPIRKILHSYTEEVFRLVPCWLASPESASVIFPMTRGFFDLVIFDEASQCFAEYAIPSAYRARQLVVAGDSKQLQPTDLYKIKYESAEEDDDESLPVELEAESLLDLAALSMDSHRLTGHYRSLSLDLIDFSNRHFYDGTLRLLPDFTYANTAEPGIEYHKTEGLWQEGTNSQEAAKVLDLLKSLEPSGKSVGIVTFNYPQQQLITEMVESSGIRIADIFVKNIENVQGDERDVIIFSTGYAPDREGRFAMQFGSLNMCGGENRLNVAVTRAREKIHVVTSLDPHQLKVENSLFPGPKLFKAYLEYASRVSKGEFVPMPAVSNGFHGSWLLKTQLKELIRGAEFELPFADLTIKNSNGYSGILFTDDDQYFESDTPKEPHAYFPLLLSEKGWPFRRIYSREFWRESGDIDKILPAESSSGFDF